jgi:coproporphyrinogen III oxidase
MNDTPIEQRKNQARAWFETLRDRIVMALEAVEDALPAGAPLGHRAAAVSCR